MPKALVRRLAPLLVLAAVPACGPTFDADSLAASLAPTYANLYVRGQELQGRTDVSVSALQSSAQCRRGGGDTLDEGPGDDWQCLVTWVPPGAGPQRVLYEVALTPEGCWRAEGPPAVVGDAQLLDVEGRRRNNPVYAFDGCLG